MITILNNLEDAVELDDVTPEMWNDWEQSPVTRHFKQNIIQEAIKSMDYLTQGRGKTKFYRGELNAYDQILNYVPRNIDV